MAPESQLIGQTISHYRIVENDRRVLKLRSRRSSERPRGMIEIDD